MVSCIAAFCSDTPGALGETQVGAVLADGGAEWEEDVAKGGSHRDGIGESERHSCCRGLAGMVTVALLTEPWFTLVGVCAVYLAVMPLGVWRYRRIRLQRAVASPGRSAQT